MKQRKTILAVVLLVQFLCACKKDLSCESCREENKPPLANAGADQIIGLPKDSVLLDGSASSDPDGSIKEWQWTKLAGPASFTLVNSAAVKTTVKDLHAGTYQFELKVIDDKGAGAKDTVQVIVSDPLQSNHPPVANAGPDQTITLPTNAVTLDGGASSDPDNNITSYLWTKLAGPPSFTISSATAVQAQISSLTEGVYRFELKVTDAGGLSANDTVQVIVNAQPLACGNSNRSQVNAQLVPVGTLSQARDAVQVASSGSKIVFAGGAYIPSGVNYLSPSSRVDIYDVAANTWSTAELSVARYDPAAVANGNKIFFAGGENGDGTWPVANVDIYDVTTNSWAVSHLSTPGNGIEAAAVGNKVLFVGGDGGFSGSWKRSTTVDIYDLTTNSWSIGPLSNEGKRGGHAAVSYNNKIYIAGGEAWPSGLTPGTWYCTNRIDIYDNATNSWSSSSLSEGKLGLAGIAVNDKIYWAGGLTGAYPSIKSSCSVEVRDISTISSATQYLSHVTGWSQAVLKENKILFFNDDKNKFDIYDIATNSWSVGVLPMAIGSAAIISVNNIVYIAGGVINGVLSNQVWKLEF